MWLNKLKQFFAPHTPDAKRIQAQIDAYERAFGPVDGVFHSTDHKAPHIDLYQFPPGADRDFITLITGGMSEFPMAVPTEMDRPERIELVLGLATHQHWATNLLKLAAEYPFDYQTWLGPGHTVFFGAELGDGSQISAFLFVEPRFIPAELAAFELDGQPISFLQAVPITTAEYEFLTEGEGDRQQLERLLEDAGCLVLRDVNRPSVIPH